MMSEVIASSREEEKEEKTIHIDSTADGKNVEVIFSVSTQCAVDIFLLFCVFFGTGALMLCDQVSMEVSGGFGKIM